MTQIRLFILTAIFILSACSPKPAPPASMELPADAWPSAAQMLRCLSQSGPVIVAHRGRDKSKGQAENSLGALKNLRARGYIMAEIDIAQLKDNTLIAFHDGILDEVSTGRGVVATSTWPQVETLLLKTRKGQITSERPVRLSDILNWANGKFYLELDIKSSANPRAIIDAVLTANMQEHVILIAYDDRQAAQLKTLSRTLSGGSILISVPQTSARKATDNPNIVWLGTKNFKDRDTKAIKAKNHFPAFGLFSPKYAPPRKLSRGRNISHGLSRRSKTAR